MDQAHPKIYLYKRVVQAKLFIEANYSEKIDLNNIADEACFSKFHFIRLFKRIYGKTPHQCLMAVRIEKAMHLLREDTSVTDACFSVGFESVTSFSTLFRRIVGITPSEYLLKQRRIRHEMAHAPLRFVPGCHAERNAASKKSNFREARRLIS
jgi:AraC-like DNA-binding protein